MAEPDVTDEVWGRHLWLYVEECGAVDRAAHLVQKFLKAFRPDTCWSLTWAVSCSKPRVGEFGGGAVFVTAQEIAWQDGHEFVADQQAAHRLQRGKERQAMSTETNTGAKYDVHLFPVVHVKIPNVEAPSPRDAITLARSQLGDVSARRLRDNTMEYTEEMSHYLVDVVGDEECLQSQFFYSQDEPLVANLGRLVNWYDARRGDASELAAIIDDAREVLKFAL